MSGNRISTKDNPIAFFEYFLEIRFIKFRNDFFGIGAIDNVKLFGDETDGDNYEKNVLAILSIIEEPGDFYLFKNKLNILLKQELNITLSLIKSSYLHFTNAEQKQYYSNILTSRVNELIEGYNSSEQLSEYLIPENYLNVILEILSADHTLDSTTSAKRIQNGFSMKEKYLSRIDELFASLENKFIAVKGTKIGFKNAFNGQSLPKTPKLIWLKIGKNGHVNKSLLIKFIQYLIADKIIEDIPDKEIKIIIPKIFLDNTGKKLQYLQQSLSQVEDSNTPDEKSLKDIISKFATAIP